MNKLIYLALMLGSSTLSCVLLVNAVTPVQQANDYTNQMSKATERAINVVAPAPQAPMMTGLGVMFGLSAIGSLWKLLGDSSNTTGSNKQQGQALAYIPTLQPEQIPIQRIIQEDRPMTTSSNSTPLASSKLSPILFAGLVSVKGVQGSGKTTLNAALVRERLLAGHEVIIINHHAAYGEYKNLELYGDGDTLEEQISHCSEGLQKLIDMRETRYATRKRKPESEWGFMSQPVTFLIEELGEYKGFVDKDLMSRFMKTVVAGVRKANIFVILSSQNNTMEMFGGTSGLASLIQEGFCTIELEGQPDPSRPGGLGPKGTGWLTVNGGQPVNVKIPDVSAMFPRGQNPLDFTDLTGDSSKKQVMELSTESVSAGLSPVGLLEKSLSLPSYEPEQPLTQDESIVLDIALECKGCVTARDIMRTNQTKCNADEIRMIFVRLASLDYGSIRGEGKKTTFEAY